MSETTNVIFAVSNICTAFKPQTIGSKVVDTLGFLEALTTALKSYDGSKDRVPGQHFVIMPEAKHLVSAGDGLKTDNAEDFVVRTHREGPKMFLKRHCAGDVQFLATVVYTREAYIADPDWDGTEDLGDATHVIVAVIASSGPSAPVTPGRFVHNLAGGNNEYKAPKAEFDGLDASDFYALQDHLDWLVNKAKEVKDYWNNYSVVAD